MSDLPQAAASVGITGFIDILGFSNRILAAERADDIHELRVLVEFVQTAFEHGTRDAKTLEEHALYGKTVLAFSDCVVVNSRFKSQGFEAMGTFDAVMSELVGYAYAQSACVARGLFLRGGVDIGWWYHSGATLVSKSLAGAYSTEQRASMPIIAISDELHGYLANHSGRAAYAREIDPMSYMFRPLLTGGTARNQPSWYVDYISICIHDLSWSNPTSAKGLEIATGAEEREAIRAQGYHDNVDEWLRDHARSIESAHSAAIEDRVAQKYVWLAEYHNSVAQVRGRTDQTRCHLRPAQPG